MDRGTRGWNIGAENDIPSANGTKNEKTPDPRSLRSNVPPSPHLFAVRLDQVVGPSSTVPQGRGNEQAREPSGTTEDANIPRLRPGHMNCLTQSLEWPETNG